MFIVALFTIVKIWKQPESNDYGIDKEIHTHIWSEYYSAIKKRNSAAYNNMDEF